LVLPSLFQCLLGLISNLLGALLAGSLRCFVDRSCARGFCGLLHRLIFSCSLFGLRAQVFHLPAVFFDSCTHVSCPRWSVFPVGFVSSWLCLRLIPSVSSCSFELRCHHTADFHVRSGCLVKLSLSLCADSIDSSLPVRAREPKVSLFPVQGVFTVKVFSPEMLFCSCVCWLVSIDVFG
jgi:hypothetical protein